MYMGYGNHIRVLALFPGYCVPPGMRPIWVVVSGNYWLTDLALMFAFTSSPSNLSPNTLSSAECIWSHESSGDCLGFSSFKSSRLVSALAEAWLACWSDRSYDTTMHSIRTQLSIEWHTWCWQHTSYISLFWKCDESRPLYTWNSSKTFSVSPLVWK